MCVSLEGIGELCKIIGQEIMRESLMLFKMNKMDEINIFIYYTVSKFSASCKYAF